MRIAIPARITLITLASILTACQTRKFESLSAPEKNDHLGIHFISVPLPDPPPPMLTPEEIQAAKLIWRQQFKPLIILTPQQQEKLKITAYLISDFYCQPPQNCFLEMRYKLKKQLTDAKQIKSMLAELNNPDNYDNVHVGCFSPGLGLQLEAPSYSRNLLICLHCRHMLVEGSEEHPDTRWLSDEAANAFKKEFKSIFPNEFLQ